MSVLTGDSEQQQVPQHQHRAQLLVYVLRITDKRAYLANLESVLSIIP